MNAAWEQHKVQNTNPKFIFRLIFRENIIRVGGFLFQAKHHPDLDADYSPREENERKGNFIKTHEMIEKHNSNPEATPKLAHNHISAMVQFKI